MLFVLDFSLSKKNMFENLKKEIIIVIIGLWLALYKTNKYVWCSLELNQINLTRIPRAQCSTHNRNNKSK